MITDAKEMYRLIFTTNLKLIELNQKLQQYVQTTSSLPELADVLFSVKQALQHTDEMNKALKRLENLSSTVICGRWMLDATGEPIRTKYTTCTPNVNYMVKTPHKTREPEAYKKFCEYFGVTDELIESGCFAPHWPAMVKHISALAEAGKPLPPGCDPSSQYPVFSATCRKNADILDEGANSTSN